MYQWIELGEHFFPVLPKVYKIFQWLILEALLEVEQW